jgi:hypothetical protein
MRALPLLFGATSIGYQNINILFCELRKKLELRAFDEDEVTHAHYVGRATRQLLD